MFFFSHGTFSGMSGDFGKNFFAKNIEKWRRLRRN